MKQLSELQKRGLRRRLQAIREAGQNRVGPGRTAFSGHGRTERQHTEMMRTYMSRFPDKNRYFLGRPIDDDRRVRMKPIHVSEVVRELFARAGAGLRPSQTAGLLQGKVTGQLSAHME